MNAGADKHIRFPWRARETSHHCFETTRATARRPPDSSQETDLQSTLRCLTFSGKGMLKRVKFQTKWRDSNKYTEIFFPGKSVHFRYQISPCLLQNGHCSFEPAGGEELQRVQYIVGPEGAVALGFIPFKSVRKLFDTNTRRLSSVCAMHVVYTPTTCHLYRARPPNRTNL